MVRGHLVRNGRKIKIRTLQVYIQYVFAFFGCVEHEGTDTKADGGGRGEYRFSIAFAPCVADIRETRVDPRVQRPPYSTNKAIAFVMKITWFRFSVCLPVS